MPMDGLVLIYWVDKPEWDDILSSLWLIPRDIQIVRRNFS